MATTNVTIVTLEKLELYDGLVKKYINDADAKSLKSVSIEGRNLKFYKEETPGAEVSPAFQIEIPETDLTTVNSAIDAVKDVVDKLDGEDTVEGSVKNQIKTTKTEIEAEIEAAKYDDTDIKSRVSTVEGDIATLNGEGAGSVKKQIDDAFNDFASKVSDDGVVNTYKELIDYCATHSAEAAEMAGEIQDNATAISTLEAYVGKLPEGTDAKTVIEYINSKVGAVDFSDAIATAKQEAIDAAKADATTKAGTAEQNAKDYADGLATNYATAAQGAKADTAVQPADLTQLKADVAANKESLGAEGATTKAIEAAKKAGDDAQGAVDALTERVDTIESTTYTEATDEEIKALFA